MRVIYDSQIFIRESKGGISRQHAELYRRLPSLNLGIAAVMPPFFGENVYARDFGLPQHGLIANRMFRGKKRLETQFSRLGSSSYLFFRVGDVFHPTYYDPYFLRMLGRTPLVVTVHDMIHELFAGSYFRFDKITSKWKQLLVDRATRLIAVSETTRRDLVRIFGVLPSKIEVVYPGNCMRGIRAAPKRTENPQKYLLFVGNRRGYKNFETFAEAVYPVLLRYKDLKIVCVGGGPFTVGEAERLRRKGVYERFLWNSPTDEELRTWYENAIALVFPSRYEGFGLPVIEAFESGCPAALSDIPAFREIAGDAAEYFEPMSPEDMRRAMERVIDSSTIRRRLIRAGTLRAKDFSWESCARGAALVYERALGG